MITYNLTFNGSHFVITIYNDRQVVKESFYPELDFALAHAERLINGGVKQRPVFEE